MMVHTLPSESRVPVAETPRILLADGKESADTLLLNVIVTAISSGTATAAFDGDALTTVRGSELMEYAWLFIDSVAPVEVSRAKYLMAVVVATRIGVL